MFGFFKKSKGSAVDGFAKRRPIATTMLCLGALGLSLGGLTTGIVLGTKKGDDAFTNDYDAPVKIEEIWNDTSFNKINLQNLFDKISGQTSVGFGTLRSMANSTAKGAIIAGTNATQMSTNANGEISVMLGGLEWTPTYLSRDNQAHTILTLWLTNNEQDAFDGLSQNAGPYHGFVYSSTTKKTGLYSDWAADWYADRPQDAFPSNMYGTSYIRTVTLNNGGRYATKQEASEADLVTVGQDENSIFAKFTMKDATGSLADYIVTPKDVQWQEYGQNTISQLSFSNTCPNENWSTEIPNNGTYMGEAYKFSTYSGAYYNYAKKTDADAWQNDKLWLPSLTETGYDSTHIGIWNTSTDQRKNYNGSSGSFKVPSGQIGEVNSNKNYATTAYTYSWLRSGDVKLADSACLLYPSGASYSYYNVSGSRAVRPALHLNLTDAAIDAGLYVPTWTDFAADKFANEDIEGIDGSSEETAYEIATAEQLALLAKRVNDPSTHDQYASKYYIQTADIRLGGHDWQPIGNRSYSFSGHYNGNGYKIEGITINSSQNGGDYGLFGYASGASIKNVNLEKGGIISEQGNIGSVAGSVIETEILNCKSTVNVEGSDAQIGGIVGYVMEEETLISQCYYSGTVKGYNPDGAGGIVGGFSYAQMTNCIFDGVVSGEYCAGVGGLIGWSEEGGAIIVDCISRGIVLASENGAGFAGFLCGTCNGAAITSCAAYGYIYAYDPTKTGALVGQGEDATLNGCSFSGTCNSDDMAPFIAYVDAEYGTPTITACYTWLNNYIKVYSDDTSDWAEYYGLAGSMNDGLPMQRSLFAIASVSPATTQDILAVFPADNGWTKYEAA